MSHLPHGALFLLLFSCLCVPSFLLRLNKDDDDWMAHFTMDGVSLTKRHTASFLHLLPLVNTAVGFVLPLSLPRPTKSVCGKREKETISRFLKHERVAIIIIITKHTSTRHPSIHQAASHGRSNWRGGAYIFCHVSLWTWWDYFRWL